MFLKLISKSLLWIVFSILIGCNSNTKQIENKLNKPSIEITNILNDSISIRALDYSHGKYWFAGSNGKFGFVDHLKDSVSLNQVEIENDLEFRSIAVNSNYTYILTAGNPALVYKISHDNDTLELVYSEKGDGVFYDSMKFWNDNEGIAMGDPQIGCFTIIKTTDAGKSWQKIDCKNMPKALPKEAAFAASNSNLKIVGDKVWFVTGGGYSRVFYSSDKGKTWKAYETPIVAGQQMTGIYATDFYDENLGVIIGGDWHDKNSNTKNKAITKDGGQTWELLADNSGPGYCSDVVFIPETKGNELLAVGTPGVWWSGNQGLKWTKLSHESFYTVVMENANEGYLAGKNRISKFKLNR